MSGFERDVPQNNNKNGGMRRSLLYAFMEKNASLLVNVAATIILSRLLTPVETGTFSVAAAFINISQFLRDFGVANYILQERDLTRQRLRSAMGLSLSMGVSLFILFLFLSAPIAAFFSEPPLKAVINILSMNFLLVAVASVGTARLSRNMDYRTVSLINFASNAVFSIVAVTLATAGYGAVSIAWASVLGVAAIILGQVAAMKGDAAVLPSLAGWPPLIRFGSFASANGMLMTLTQRGPDILIGRLMGFADAGLFSRGNSLVTLFEAALMASVRSVVANGLAAIRRQGNGFDAALLQCYGNLSAVAWPFLSVLSLLAHPIILILFGNQWLASIAPARWLCVAALFGAVTNIGMMALTAAGAMRPLFLLQCVNAVLVGPAVVIGCFIGLEAVAIGLTASSAITAILSLRTVNATFGLSIKTILRAMAGSAIVTLTTCLPPALALSYWNARDDLWAPVLASALGSAIVWALTLRMIRHPLWDELLRLAPRLRAV